MRTSPYFRGWNVVIGAGIGIGSGSIAFFPSCYGLLSAAMAKDFGWAQAEVAKGASIFLLAQMVAYPLCGLVLDRWGSRAFAAFSIGMFALSLVALAQVNGPIWQLDVALAFMALVSAGTNVVSYARALAQWFDRRRGLAMGLAAGSQALGLFAMPLAFHRLDEGMGWSRALLPFAAFELLVTLPVVLLLVKDSPARYGLGPDGTAANAVVSSSAAVDGRHPSLREVFRSSVFWRLALCFAFMGMSFYAIAPNIVYILTKKAGMGLGEVAIIQALSGLATLCGRIGFGMLLDRFHAAAVSILALALTASCALIYATSDSVGLVVFAAILNGLAAGGDTDLMPYLASRYFGATTVSRVFGWFLFAFFLGAAIGPVAFARLSGLYGGADRPLMMLAALQLLPAIVFVTLWRHARAAMSPAVGTA